MVNETAPIGASHQSELSTKVLKGSVWTLLGNIGPLIVAPVTAPFTIRLLGAEGYGVFSLIGLLPLYLSFADFGMSFASTKFASGAYAEGDEEREASVVRTSALLATLSFLPFLILVLIFSNDIALLFNISGDMLSQASVALKLAAVSLYFSILSGIFNTPQLSRLRMGSNALINSVPRIVALVVVPIVVYLGFGVVGAVAVGLASAIVILICHLTVSRRLLPQVFRLGIEGSAVRPLLRFGSGFVASSVAAVSLANAEKVILGAVTTPIVFAQYAVAFRLAEPLSLFSLAMTQSLIPAFSQLQSDDRREEFQRLFSRALGWIFVSTAPLVASMLVLSEPLLILWAGREIGSGSVVTLCIMVVGLTFNLLAFIPYAVIISSGRTGFLAKVYFVELVPYAAVVWYLTTTFGAKGAAMAWSLRVIADAAVLFLSVRRSNGLTPRIRKPGVTLSAVGVLAVPVLCFIARGGFELWMAAVLIVSLTVFATVAFRYLLATEDVAWVRGAGASLLARVKGRQVGQ